MDRHITEINEVDLLIKQYNLDDHPEGGYFKEIWKSGFKLEVGQKDGCTGPREAASSIYYLIPRSRVLKWHRLILPEIYFWHSGGTLKLHFIDKDGKYFHTFMGDTLKGSQRIYQIIIEANTWIAGEVMEDGSFTFFSNIVVPGFDYADWELGTEGEMVKENPQHETIIRRFFN